MTSGLAGENATSVLQGHYDAEYMGGHPEYPAQTSTDVLIYNDKIELEAMGLEIPYSSMTLMENIDKEKISAGRVVSLGLIFPEGAVVGALWKKNHRYTVIQYQDGLDTPGIVLDFGDYIDEVQPLIYRRMVRFRRIYELVEISPERLEILNGFSIYTNTNYGFAISYPSSWVEDEIDQKNGELTTIVQFRESLKNKPPFVTVYVNKLSDKNISLQVFAYQRKAELQNESTVKSLRSYPTKLDGDLAYQLTYEDSSTYRRYKQSVILAKKENEVYEISYSARYEQFPTFLNIVEKMVESFRFTNNFKSTSSHSKSSGRFVEYSNSSPQELTASNMDESLLILKKRFAEGEITQEEYHRMKKVLES